MKNFITKVNKTGGDDSGSATSWGANESNSITDELKLPVTSTGQTLSPGTGIDPDVTKLAKAITIASQTSHSYSDSGSANSYILTRSGTLEQPVDYVDGMRVTLSAANANTGASVVNISALGLKKILLQDGSTALSGGEIKAGELTELIYSSAADTGTGAFLYAPWSVSTQIASTAEAQAGTNDSRAISPLKLREGLNATGTAPIYATRAWVNFDGTGIVAIRASGNISSVTDNGTGDYTINFTTPMPDANFAVGYGSGDTGIPTGLGLINPYTRTTGGVSISVRNDTGTPADRDYVSINIQR